MSHMICVKSKFKDLEALEKACKNLGWTFHKNQKTFKWYGTWVNDYSEEDAAYLNGVKVEDFGKCSHAISIPGCKYQAGLVEGEQGSSISSSITMMLS